MAAKLVYQDAGSWKPPVFNHGRLTVDVLLGDALRPYEGRQAPDISLKHAFVHREVWAAPGERACVALLADVGRLRAAGFGAARSALVLRRRRRLRGRSLRQLVVAEHFTRPAPAARLWGREGPARSLLVRLQQAPILARPVLLAQGADLLSGHFFFFFFPKPVQVERAEGVVADDDPPGEPKRPATRKGPHKQGELHMKTLLFPPSPPQPPPRPP